MREQARLPFALSFSAKELIKGELGLYFLTYGGPSDLLFEYASTYEFVKRTYFGKEICYIDLESRVEKAESSDDVLNALSEELDRYRPTRIVIENVSVLEEVLKNEYWRFLLKLTHLIKAKKVVALVTGDSKVGEPYPAKIAQVADGIILLQNEEINFTRRRSIQILKMCGTSHHLGKYAVDISVKGLIVYPGL